MKFTEHMQIFGIDSAPHAQLRAVMAHAQPCPDPSRKERARGEEARQVIVEALEMDGVIEWINIVTPCGQEAVVEYVRRCDPDTMPEPVLIESEQKKRKVKAEVEGR